MARTTAPVPAELAEQLRAAEAAFQRSRAEHERTARERAATILDATEHHGLSRRQLAEVLGLSPMRVQQLVEQARRDT